MAMGSFGPARGVAALSVREVSKALECSTTRICNESSKDHPGRPTYSVSVLRFVQPGSVPTTGASTGATKNIPMPIARSSRLETFWKLRSASPPRNADFRHEKCENPKSPSKKSGFSPGIPIIILNHTSTNLYQPLPTYTKLYQAIPSYTPNLKTSTRPCLAAQDRWHFPEVPGAMLMAYATSERFLKGFCRC